MGVRLPAHLTANGRSILAHVSAAQIRALFPSSASFIQRTERGPKSLAELRRILQTERAQGWAEEVGDDYRRAAILCGMGAFRPCRPALGAGVPA